MRKTRVDQLIIEITRKCNMECEHCLRGSRQNEDMDISVIPSLFENIDSIGTLVFSGGEPTLNVSFITSVVDHVIENNINVNGCLIVTNGKVYNQEMVDAVKRLMYACIKKRMDVVDTNVNMSLRYKYMQEDLEAFGIAVSMDNFHEPVSPFSYFKYRTSGVYTVCKEVDFNENPRFIIARGRGADLANSTYRPVAAPYITYDDDSTDIETVYVSTEGNVFTDCDLSYDMMEGGFGNVYEKNLVEIIEDLRQEFGRG